MQCVGDALSALDLEMVELARLRAGGDLGPVHSHALERAWRVKSTTGLEAQRRPIALGDLTRWVEHSAVTLSLLEHREGLGVPHFDRLVVRARDDSLAIRREGNRVYAVVVGVLLLGFELESAWEACRQVSEAKE